MAVAVFTVSVLAFSPMAAAAAILAIANVAVSCRPRAYAILGGYLLVLVLVAVDASLSLGHTGSAGTRLYAPLPRALVAATALGAGLLGRAQHAKRESEQRVRVQQARAAERTRCPVLPWRDGQSLGPTY